MNRNMNGRPDSFSSDDELPLSFSMPLAYSINNISNEKNSYANLCRKMRVDCDFCDRTFNSRYQSAIHNATHIIIPLINHSVVECGHCNFCFTSTAELQRHMLHAHPRPRTTEERPRVRIRSLLQFEDHPTDILDSLKAETDDKDERTSPPLKNIHIFGRVKEDVQLNGFSEPKEMKQEFVSVHYEELRIPVVVRCHYCKQKFKDRYELAVHQASHLQIKPLIEAHKLPTGQGPLRSDDMHICDLCLDFLQPTAHRKYLKTGVVSRPGERTSCDTCSRSFFELNLVTRTQTRFSWKDKRRRKRLTNDQRLKNIRHRLKAANKVFKRLHVFYLVGKLFTDSVA